MTIDQSNPYEFVSAEQQMQSGYRRSAVSTVAALLHSVGYLLLALASVLMVMLVLAGGLDDARNDEAALAVLVAASGPVAGWLLLMEIGCFRMPDVRRERLLSRMAVAASVAPVLLSVFWFNEFLMSGAWDLNAVPAIWAALFAAAWLLSAVVRVVSVPDSQPEPHVEQRPSNAQEA